MQERAVGSLLPTSGFGPAFASRASARHLGHCKPETASPPNECNRSCQNQFAVFLTSNSADTASEEFRISPHEQIPKGIQRDFAGT